MSDQYSYESSVKSRQSDELINTFLLRPLAGLIVRILYHTPVTPNQLTLFSIAVGLAAAFSYLKGSPNDLIIAGVLVTAKDLLDSADGQLARAKSQFSRAGRFLDSIGDIVVNAAIFTAIGFMLLQQHGTLLYPFLALLAFAGVTLRVSYHVYYQVSYLHLHELYAKNRITEELTDEDRKGDRLALRLQQVFLLLYGWQDRMMLRLDRWCRAGIESPNQMDRWYSDLKALRISSFLGIGTELFILMGLSVLDQLELYLAINVGLLNGVWMFSVLYRRWGVRRRILREK